MPLELKPVPAPAEEQCHTCGVRATTTLPLAKCSRCEMAYYCSSEHQMSDFETHKTTCRAIKLARESMANAEEALRSGRDRYDRVVDTNPLETHVGKLSALSEGQKFLSIKTEYVHSLAAMDSATAIATALHEAADCLRLSHDDRGQLRDGIAVLLLLQGEIQQCYDFIKWWAKITTPLTIYDLRVPTLPYLDIHGAEMTEPIDFFQHCKSVWMLAALTFIKVTLVEQVDDLIQSCAVLGAHESLPTTTSDRLCQFLKLVVQGGPSRAQQEQLPALRETLWHQACAAFEFTRAQNEAYWPAMLDPSVLEEHDYGNIPHYPWSQFCKKMKPWLAPNVQLWKRHEEFIETMLEEP